MGTPFITGGLPRMAHQTAGLKKLIETRGCAALLFDPGTGKTATLIDYASVLALKLPTGEARVLVVCPLVAVDTWVEQVEKWASPQINYWAEALGGTIQQRADALAARGPLHRASSMVQPKRGVPKHHPRALNYQYAHAWASRGDDGQPVQQQQGPSALRGEKPTLVLEVLNLDTFARRDKIGGKTIADVVLASVKRFQPDLVVVDESHKIKGGSSNVSRLMDRIGQVVPRRAILTGTVMPHSPLDVFAQWRFLEPYAFGERVNGVTKRATEYSFKARYCQMGGWMGKQIVGWRNLDEMQAIMAKNAVVARKENALDLPPVTDVEVPIELSPAEKQAYADMKAQLVTILSSGDTASVSNRLAQMMRLRQITGGFLPDDNHVMHEIGSSKVDTIKSLVHDTLAGEKRIVIFALFTAEIAILKQKLARKGTEIMVITGGTPHDDRVAMRQRFGSDDPARIVMIAQVKTMSLAVNELVTANHAIFGSLSQQRDDWIQARDRLNRMGQKRPVTFWTMLARGTVDEVVLQSHKDGTSLEAAMLKHIMEDTERANASA